MQFEHLSIDPRLIKQLSHQGITDATEIQQQAIPIAMAGHDLFAQSKTGSGKTLAYLLPAVTRLIKQKALAKNDPRVVILTPTRELANQVFTALRLLIASTQFKAVKIVGGENFNDQIKAINKNPHIIVGTPGRIADHIGQRTLYLNGLELLILDEADRMLDLGFKSELDSINNSADHRLRQTLLFSATLDHAEIGLFSKELLKTAKNVSVSDSGATHTDITAKHYFADHLDHKQQLLTHFLKGSDVKQSIVFTATRTDTQRLAQLLTEQGIEAEALSGELDQNKRQQVIECFSKQQFKVLVTTDVASRGLDLLSVSHVINFDMPKHAEEYVHRIGRTGRAGFKGIAISLISAKDWQSFVQVQSFVKEKLQFFKVDTLPAKFSGFKPRTTKVKTSEKQKTHSKKPSKPNQNRPKTKKSVVIPQPDNLDGFAPLKKKKRAAQDDE